MKNSTQYLLISLATFIIGYIYLRFAYASTEDIPFVQEIVLVVLGTIVTIAITAALLNKQSEVEIEKEQRVKIFDLKSNLYFDLIEFIESILKKSEITEKDLITLEFLTHKISVIANLDVLKAYSDFTRVFKETTLDSKINALESDAISSELARLCGAIRYDLINKEDETSLKVQKIIDHNIQNIIEEGPVKK
jgi:phosphoenolpyruvate carboxylase